MTLMLLVLALCGASAQSLREYKGHIVDASTGESIPYATVQTAPGKGTLSNSNGDFTVLADSQCRLRIRFVGYDEYVVEAGKLPNPIRLKPATKVLKEVSVVAVSGLLKHMIDKLNREYRTKSKKKSQYFCRVNELLVGHHELFETFLNAQSAVNLRELAFFSGKRAVLSRDSIDENMKLENINFHHTMELGPMVRDNDFWSGVYTPLDPQFFGKQLQQFYDMSCTLLRSSPTEEDPEGKQVYCIHMKRKDQKSDTRYIHPILTGNIYVDPNTYELLQFDGNVEGISLEVKTKRMERKSMMTNILLNIHVNYKHDKKYTEVNSLACTFSKKDFKSRILLFNIDNLEMKMKKVHRVSENMLDALEASGFKNQLWEETNIVQRTQEEERIARNDTTNLAYRDSTLESVEAMDMKKYEQQSYIKPPVTPGLIQIYRNLGKNTRYGQEKVFVHMDNSSYFLGDTIWFAAYTRHTLQDKPSEISNLLYVELLNEDGFLVERKQIQMHSGRGNGFFVLDPEMAYSGFYELRAYTRWQLNWGAYERPHSAESKQWFFNEEFEHKFFTDYEKLYSRVFPVYDAPRRPGEYRMEMQARRSPQDSLARKRELKVNFFPEGGTLVGERDNYVAYEARWSDGQWAEGRLHIGKDAYPTLNRGRGRFRIRPQKIQQKATFVTTDGKDSVTVELPKAEDQGIAFHVAQNDSTWEFTMWPTDNLESLEFALTIMQDDRMYVFHPFVRAMDRFIVPREVLPEGVCQATLFGMRGEVLADRLLFSKGTEPVDTPTVAIEGLQANYEPLQRVELKVKSPNRNGFTRRVMSLSVQARSNDAAPSNRSNIYTEMLLSSEIRGYVPDACWFFESDDEEHRTALDLLMMTQGWRRFSWHDAAFNTTFPVIHFPESAPIFSGRVWTDNQGWDLEDFGGMRPTEFNKKPFSMEEKEEMELFEPARMNKTPRIVDPEVMEADDAGEMAEWQERKKNASQEETPKNETLLDVQPKHEVQVHGTLLNPENIMDPENTELRTKEGYFRVRVPDLNHVTWMLIGASDKTKWSKERGFEYPWVMEARDREALNNSPLPEFKVCLDYPYPRFVKPYDYYQCHLTRQDSLQGFLPSAETFVFDTTLEEFSVDGKKKKKSKPTFDDSHPAFTVDALEAYNNAYDAGLMPDEQGVLRAYFGLSGRDVPQQFRFGKKRAKYNFWIGDHKADTIYRFHNLETAGSIGSFSPGDRRRFNSMRSRDRYVFYTDFKPRELTDTIALEKQLNNTHMAIYLYHGDERRRWFRGRQFVLPGFAAPAQFYQVDYSQQAPPQQGDYRRTLYWNPSLVMDKNGEATISFYNNSVSSHLGVEAEGQGADGTLLWTSPDSY